jgi:hypothetical protein
LEVSLSWECSDPDDGGLTYDVYFGVTHDPPLLSSGQEERYLDLEDLEFSTIYYWRVVARDCRNRLTSGPLWSFSTRRESGLYPIGGCELGTYFMVIAYRIFVTTNLLLLANSSWGLLIVDVSDPFRPSPVGTFDLGWTADVSAAGDYAYLADFDSGLVAVDISDAYHPVIVGRNSEIGYALCLFVHDNLAYVGASGGIFVMDVSNPTSLSILGNCDDCGFPYTMRVEGDYAYSLHTGFETTYLNIADISDPSAPVMLGTTYAGGMSTEMEIKDNYVYIAEWWGGEINIIDVSDPDNPIFANSYESYHSLTDISITGDLAFVANTYSGLKVLDISDRLYPVEVCEFVAEGSAINVFYANELIYLIYSLGDDRARLYILEYEP